MELLKLDFTKKEEEILIDELAERLKNVAYMLARNRIKEAYNQLKNNHSNFIGTENITISLELGFIINDLFEIVGGLRRNKDVSSRLHPGKPNSLASNAS